MSQKHFRSLIIIGAPRSGTNMLRDILTLFPGVSTWPCDEINYIWRHRNLRYPSDELSESLARDGVRRYIRRQFEWVANRYAADVVVEKTCANSLRVPFVDQVVPEARYVFIYRCGLDAVGSAMARWKAPLNIPYLARKARFVPATDLPWYAARYLGSRLHQLISAEGRVGLWGPKFDGMDALLAARPLNEVCAFQWRRCVEASIQAFSAMPREKWLHVSYEDFVRQPEQELRRILDFMGIHADDDACRTAVAGVSCASLGKGAASLGAEAVCRLQPIVSGAIKTLESSI